MRPQPLELEALVVEATRERRVRHLRNMGFYQRREAGFGHFITPEELERRVPFDAMDLLRSAPRTMTRDNGIAVRKVIQLILLYR